MGIALESAALRVRFEETVNRARTHSGCFRQPFRRASCRRGELHVYLFAAKDLENRLNKRRLADARPPGDDEEFGSEGLGDGCALARCEFNVEFLFRPRDRFFGVEG